jgi:hypothetical protein
VILSRELRDYLIATRAKDARLPISRTTVKKLRRVLGLHWRHERRQWWESKADELAAMNGRLFAQTYGMSEAAVSIAHKRLFGRRLRSPHWWLKEPARSLLRSKLPRAYVAEELGISVSTVGRLRWVARLQSR